MSPAPATRTFPPRRPRRIVEGLFAAAALIAFVAGVPVVLRIVAPISWPNPWPTWGQAGAALSRPDDGTLFTGALTVVVWAGWAWLTVSILIEVVAALTHVKIPAIPLLKLSRGAAKALVATAGVLLATSTPLVTSGAPHTPTSIQLVLPKQPTTWTVDATLTGAGTGLPPVPHAVAAAQRFSAPSLPAAVDRHPVITVRRGDNLWDLAERHLGAGQRFTEIVDLNLHRPQPDGRTLTEEGWVYPGWTLRLPQDAGALPAPTSTTADVAADGSQTVQDVTAGDSLWVIAETRLGDGARYPEIYDLNIGAPQPGGATLTDPDLIRPGWHLAVPAGRPAPTTPAPTTPAPSTAGDRAPQPPSTGVPAPAPHVQSDTSTQALRDVDPRSYARQGAGGGAAPSERAPGETGSGPRGPQTTVGSTVLVLGLTTLAAAGLTGELARRRRRQHRLRRAGERIALPEPGSDADLAERALRQAVQPMTLEALRTGLLRLSSTCSAEGRDLPRIAVIVVGEDTIDAIVTADDESPVKPFVSIDARTWRTSHDALRNQHDPVDLEMFPDPYPALVTLGITDRGTVLVNLEATGTFSVNGTGDVTAAGMRALACELATSALTANTVLVLGPEYADLAQASPSVIITSVPDGADLDRRSGVLAAAHRDILARAGVTDALRARSLLTGDDTWNPTVFLGSGQSAAAQAWAGHVIVTAGKKTEWRLDLRDDYTGRLEPVGLTIEAQHLPADAYRNLVELLQNAAQETERDELDELVTVDEELDQIRTVLPAGSRTLTFEALSKESSGVDGDPSADPARPTPEAEPPRVLLLGRVSVTGVAHGKADRERRNTELVAFLACNPGASADQIDDVLGHGARIDNKNRNARISRIRSWLGSDSTGRPYLMKIESHDDYRLAPAIRSDWDDFLDLANRGLAQGKDGAADLRAALTLVRGRPFLGVPRGSYAWADALTHEMIDTITDVAHALALINVDTHDYRGAQRAAAIGLTANSCNEQLFRDAIAAAHRAGDDNEVERLVATLRTRIEQIDPDGDLEDDTIELIETLQLAESNDH